MLCPSWHPLLAGPTYYEILGLTPETATPREIKKQYRAKSRMHHPDVGGAADDFKLVAAAYEVLSTPVLKEIYDDIGHDAFLKYEVMPAKVKVGESNIRSYVEVNIKPIIAQERAPHQTGASDATNIARAEMPEPTDWRVAARDALARRQKAGLPVANEEEQSQLDSVVGQMLPTDSHVAPHVSTEDIREYAKRYAQRRLQSEKPGDRAEELYHRARARFFHLLALELMEKRGKRIDRGGVRPVSVGLLDNALSLVMRAIADAGLPKKNAKALIEAISEESKIFSSAPPNAIRQVLGSPLSAFFRALCRWKAVASGNTKPSENRLAPR